MLTAFFLAEATLFAIDEVTIKRGDESRGSDPWLFCADEGNQAFTTSATFLETDGNAGDTPIVDVTWKIEFDAGDIMISGQRHQSPYTVTNQEGNIPFSIAPPQGDASFATGTHTLEVTVTNADDSSDTDSDTDTVRMIRFGVFRDAACTKVLDDWPEDGSQLRSPKYIFGKEDYIYMEVEGPSGLGNSHFDVRVTSESDSTTGVSLDLDEVTPGVYRTTSGEYLALADSTNPSGPADLLKVLDEEVLDFHLEAGGDIVCQKEIMVDRREFLMIAGSEHDKIFPVVGHFNSNVAAGRNGISSSPILGWENGYLEGKHYDSDTVTVSDKNYEESKASAYKNGAHDGSSRSDCLYYCGHGGDGILVFQNVIEDTPLGGGAAWKPSFPGENGWSNDVDFAINASCSVLGTDSNRDAFVTDFIDRNSYGVTHCTWL